MFSSLVSFKHCCKRSRSAIMQGVFNYFLLLSFLYVGSQCEISETTDLPDFTELPCAFDEVLKDGQCVEATCYDRKICGTNTNCSSAGYATYCSCMRGFTGNPLVECFKMDEKSPCDPNPCGPNAKCVPEDPEIGPHCKCSDGFYDFPPKCREGCKDSSQCGPTQICDHKNNCEELCEPNRCGENSICRVDKEKRTVHCSCKEGYIPETDIGCILKTANDSDIPLDLFADVLHDKCGGECGYNAYCGPDEKCICTEGYQGDPLNGCEVITSDRVDPCNPNPCGGYSSCQVVDNEAKCSCVEGYGTAPYCSKCFGPLSCSTGDVCSEGRCVFNVCKPHCGSGAGCAIHEGRLECFCRIQGENTHTKPYKNCPEISFISAAVIATLAG